MKTAPFAIAVVIIVVAAVANRVNANSDVLGTESTASPTPTISSSPQATVMPTATPSPTSTNTPTQSPTSTPTPTATATSAPVSSSWVYPGSNVENNNPIVAYSSASTDDITSWYKSKIEQEGYTARNVIKTNSNNMVKNVLQAQKGNSSVNVEITKGPGDTTAKIEVSF